jgi:ABC-type amino acid transport substrate-binding protein
MRAVLLLATVLTVAACAAQPGTTGASSRPSPAGAAGASGIEDELVVVIDRGDGSAPERYRLNCADVAGSDHPAAQAACDHLAGMDEPFAALPADAMCAQVYDGPAIANVTGRWRGEAVDLHLARNDGCRITQWDSLGPLLPGPG